MHLKKRNAQGHLLDESFCGQPGEATPHPETGADCQQCMRAWAAASATRDALRRARKAWDAGIPGYRAVVEHLQAAADALP